MFNTVIKLYSMYRPPAGKHVFKIRIANSNDDYIEIEMDSHALSYRTLMERCCLELNVDGSQIDKIRKMPDVRVRSDEDVKRFNTYEAIEVVLKSKS